MAHFQTDGRAVTDLSEAAASAINPIEFLGQACDPLDSVSAREAETVLLAIADARDRRLLANALSDRGCKLLMAADAESALQVIKALRPNLVLFDIGLSGNNGLQQCALLSNGELSGHIPMILLAHGSGAQEKLQGLKLGAVDYISKPFDWTEVAEQICSQLKLDRARKQLVAANFELTMKQARHQAELKAAAAIQRSLLPRRTTEKFKNLSVSWTFVPLEQVGGDLLGYTWLDEDHLATYVVDVCGHGLPAAMMTAAISTSLAAPVGPDDSRTPMNMPAAFSPKELLERLGREYPLERFERPFTISYLVLNRKTGEFRCSRAGHPMPIIIRRGGQLESIEAGGTIIGLDHMLPVDESIGRLNPGDSILLYSDGVTECVNEAGPFGLKGLEEVLRQCSGLSPETVCENIMTALRRFNRGAAMQDDVSILALSYGDDSASTTEVVGRLAPAESYLSK